MERDGDIRKWIKGNYQLGKFNYKVYGKKLIFYKEECIYSEKDYY